jgi:hypothetical protein
MARKDLVLSMFSSCEPHRFECQPYGCAYGTTCPHLLRFWEVSRLDEGACFG